MPRVPEKSSRQGGLAAVFLGVKAKSELLCNAESRLVFKAIRYKRKTSEPSVGAANGSGGEGGGLYRSSGSLAFCPPL